MTYNNKQLLLISSQRVSWAFLIIWAEPSEVHTHLCGQFGGFADLGRVVSHVSDSSADSALLHVLSHSTHRFVHRAAEGFQKKSQIHEGSLDPSLRKGITLLLLQSIKSNYKGS